MGLLKQRKLKSTSKMKNKIIQVVISFIGIVAFAQQDPHYTQYMYNMSMMNPAYAGSKENLSLGLLHRNQWVGIEDAPTTATFFAHAPVAKNVGLGLSFISDRIGPVKENNIYADFSYTLNLGEKHKLAFGLKGGLTLHNVGLFDGVYSSLIDGNDPAFSENTNDTFFNIGTGIFYYTDKYYVGLSVPNMLKSKHLDVNGREFGSEVSHYFLTGGYVFDLNQNLKFKPFFMMKSAFGVPASWDISGSFLFNEKFEIGATYRLEDSFGAMVNYSITQNFRIGYAYDHIVSDLNFTAPSSHEIILLFDLNFPKKVSSSPRFF